MARKRGTSLMDVPIWKKPDWIYCFSTDLKVMQKTWDVHDLVSQVICWNYHIWTVKWCYKKYQIHDFVKLACHEHCQHLRLKCGFCKKLFVMNAPLLVSWAYLHPPKSDDRYAQLTRGAFITIDFLQNPHFMLAFCWPTKYPYMLM